MPKSETDFLLNLTPEEWERIGLLANEPAKSLAVLMHECADIKARLHVVTVLLTLSLDTRFSKAETEDLLKSLLEEGRKKYGQRAASRLVTLGGLQDVGGFEPTR